jgi:hypothetical protein
VVRVLRLKRRRSRRPGVYLIYHAAALGTEEVPCRSRQQPREGAAVGEADPFGEDVPERRAPNAEFRTPSPGYLMASNRRTGGRGADAPNATWLSVLALPPEEGGDIEW